MADTISLAFDTRFPQRVGAYGKVGLITGVATLSAYDQTKTVLTALTGLFLRSVRVFPDPISSLGYLLRWDITASAFRAYSPGAVSLALPAAGAAVAITPPASTVAYTNADAVPQTVIITGGTSTHAVIGRTSGSFTSADVATVNPIVVHLDPGDTLTVTYSVAGTWTKLPFPSYTGTIAAAVAQVATSTNVGVFNFSAYGQLTG